jgi:hypothetical protein
LLDQPAATVALDTSLSTVVTNTTGTTAAWAVSSAPGTFSGLTTAGYGAVYIAKIALTAAADNAFPVSGLNVTAPTGVDGAFNGSSWNVDGAAGNDTFASGIYVARNSATSVDVYFVFAATTDEITDSSAAAYEAINGLLGTAGVTKVTLSKTAIELAGVVVPENKTLVLDENVTTGTITSGAVDVTATGASFVVGDGDDAVTFAGATLTGDADDITALAGDAGTVTLAWNDGGQTLALANGGTITIKGDGAVNIGKTKSTVISGDGAVFTNTGDVLTITPTSDNGDATWVGTDATVITFASTGAAGTITVPAEATTAGLTLTKVTLDLDGSKTGSKLTLTALGLFKLTAGTTTATLKLGTTKYIMSATASSSKAATADGAKAATNSPETKNDINIAAATNEASTDSGATTIVTGESDGGNTASTAGAILTVTSGTVSIPGASGNTEITTTSEIYLTS